MAQGIRALKPSRLLARLLGKGSPRREATLAGPIRGELLGIEHLAERARRVARSQRVVVYGRRRRGASPLARLAETSRILEAAHTRLAAAVEQDINIGPAGEWLLDNYHVIVEHIREVRESLPRGYYRELPELMSGPMAGYPRVYQVAISLISHTEGRIDLENVDAFVTAFQEMSPLTIGELWAMPAMLRLGMIENVRRMALRTVQRLDEVEGADRWVHRIQEASESGSRALNEVLERFVSGPPALTVAFVSRLLQQLRLAQIPVASLARLEQWIEEEGLNADDATARATQRLALTQITMANSITSLRAVARMDWRVFVERQSVMESALRTDPSGFYPRMTFATRDQYRHSVERIAKRCQVPEETIARLAVDLARSVDPGHEEDRRREHVGFYLVDDGLPELERAAGYRPTLRESAHRWVVRHPNVVFVGGILNGTLAALALLLWLAEPVAILAWPLVLAFGFLPAFDIAVNVVNQLVTALLPPRTLPKLDLGEHGVPQEFRTAVVIPTLFDSVDAVHESLETLEAQFLANRESHLHFALLSDFTDAPSEHVSGDEEIIAAAIAGIRSLNERYGHSDDTAFYLFHRPRRWNPQEGVWMGWERKRGKLAEFNRFLRGAGDGAFSVIVGKVQPLQGVRYVITLDADTVLPPDAAPLLIGALAHPLNRAVYDPVRGRVVQGYGILQPRVGVSLPSAHRSRFAAIHSGHPGVDPYTTAVSDVYQDLYGEGSFTGKGIYDVDAFERATHGRFPENTLLSHDLIEGNYARAGLATDITVYDDYPRTYPTYTRRKHRWIRGDWQLLPWLGFGVPGPDGQEPNRLSLLSRWKIFDNMRRSTVEIGQLAFLFAGWLLFPGSPARWTLLGLAAIAAPWLVALLLAAMRPPMDKSWRAYYSAVGHDAITSIQQLAVRVVFLPHQAWVSADAILRTLWRLAVSRRYLLEWRTASQIERAAPGRRAWLTMVPSIAVALALAGLAIEAETHRWRADTLPVLLASLLPLAALWLASPLVARGLNTPVYRWERRLDRREQTQALRYALLHWHYFDRFVTAESNWLVPDNFQEHPAPVVTLRTSPTNMGLQLLSVISAYDLRLITMESMLERLELAFASMERMHRFRGHFYNWYDLADLRVLEPGYISTVDSGNLAGHLLAIRQACLAVADDPVFDMRVWRALQTGLDLARELLEHPGGDAVGTERQSSPAAQVHVLQARGILEAASPADPPVPILDRLADALDAARDELAGTGPAGNEDAAAKGWIDWCRGLVAQHRSRIGELPTRLVPRRESEATVVFDSWRTIEEEGSGGTAVVRRLQALAGRASRMVEEMDFRFLFDDKRKLFAIGYQQASHALDPSYYDLLASEARLASFVAIAKNDVPVDHWFRLGRTLTRAGGQTALVSWSGSMFEYLMPQLVMQSFPFTVLDQTYRAALERHIAYGAERDVPWGVSESAYNIRDRHLTYQYRAFGVPDLALKRGLGRDLVVAPYASGLAVMIDASRALANLKTLERKGALGPYGFRDALDYTRPDPGQRWAVVRLYMAHHEGMTLVALTNALTAEVWQRRFHTDPLVRSAELLLHERIPRRLVLQPVQTARADESLPDPELERAAVRVIDTPDTDAPRAALLGNQPYTIMVTHAGAGYSRYENLAVTRWRADGTRDDTGQFCYLKDLGTGRAWSAAHQPLRTPADSYHAFLSTDRVVFDRTDGPVSTRTEITVVPADSAEVRRVTVTNNSNEERDIELTSYSEIVLAPPDTDRSHPAFSNLFIETEWHEWCTAITASRRPRSATEPVVWCAHVVDTGPERIAPVTCETSRVDFIGRGRTTQDPLAMERDGGLPGHTGAVLDPIFAIRTRVRLAPGQSASVAFTTLVATTREQVFELAGRYHGPHAAQRALNLAWTAAQVELRELGITPAEAGVFQDVAGYLFHGHRRLRAPQAELLQNRGSQPLLWSCGISGDWPIMLAMISAADGLPTLRQAIMAHRYWRRRGMTVDLVVLNSEESGYHQELGDRITGALVGAGDLAMADRPGGVFVRKTETLGPEELLMLRATARIHLHCDGRPLGRILEGQLDEEETGLESDDHPLPRVPGLATATAVARALWRNWSEADAGPGGPPPAGTAPRRTNAPGAIRPPGDPALAFPNGFGGQLPDGQYEIRVHGDHVPPAPWINVIANQHGGFLVSERGGGCSWARNSYFYRLSPWSNDPVSDPPGEVIYLRDVESDELWCPTPAPIPHGIPAVVRHGQGVTTFEQEHRGIATRLTLTVADDAMVKLSVLSLTNRDTRPRTLALTAYVEWTLGSQREHTRHQVQTEFDPALDAMLARNYFNPQFQDMVAFCALTQSVTGFTGDRREFLGRNGSAADPAGLRGAGGLSGTTGAGIDPCAALQCVVHLQPGETREVTVLLGAAAGRDEAVRMVRHYRETAAEAARSTALGWVRRLSVITVRTPEPSFDAMINHWLLYQALACRMWGRSALYQSSGAYGFRDQLQDVLAFVYAEPGVAREHILRAASRQFVEGDVQHWWHPESGRGVRTRFSDDLLWLPYVVDQYIRVTGDDAILDESISFLAMRELEPHEHEVYDLPSASGETGTLFEHCLRAIRRGATAGVHGLPLIGIGDWNDGMNRVGIEGKGESVWLAWFLVTVLRDFAGRAEARGEAATAAGLRAQADAYTAAVEAEAWDGAWYRRAYFDDGSPLGSHLSNECNIDSIAQSWSVISGAGKPERQVQAMQSLEAHLVDREARLVRLLTPPFDKTTKDPGYIKGYLPGVRENGAQYTHAALWAVLARATQGDTGQAFDLFQLLNPLTHGDSREAVERYKVEPYVVAADVYTARGHVGRGGWTWYTGSASWMYRVGLEAILGFTLRGNLLEMRPCVPASWPEFSLEYQFGGSRWEILVQDPGLLTANAKTITVDGRAIDGPAIRLVDDGARHKVVIRPAGG